MYSDRNEIDDCKIVLSGNKVEITDINLEADTYKVVIPEETFYNSINDTYNSRQAVTIKIN